MTKTENQNAAIGGSKKKIYLWLKSRAYVNEKERLDGGFYIISKEYPRLKNATPLLCEIFVGDVPSRKLAEIAQWSGIDPNKYRDDDELQDLLTTQPKPFA